MLYTLLKFLGWGALLAFIGGCIGWALRSLKCRGEVARARATTVDTDEVERMRHRLANLEHVVAERDRLRIQLADVRHADSPGVVGASIDGADSDAPSASSTDAAESEPADAPSIVPAAAERAAAEQTGDEQTGDEAAGGEVSGPGNGAVAGFAAIPESDADATNADESTSEAEPEVAAAPALDLAAAAAAIGKKIKLDDLTVVEGIGPKISELCSGIGITTWRQLADTDVAELQSMLDAAGSRYSVHKPGTWPQQSALLANGEWDAFKTLTDQLDGGR